MLAKLIFVLNTKTEKSSNAEVNDCLRCFTDRQELSGLAMSSLSSLLSRQLLNYLRSRRLVTSFPLPSLPCQDSVNFQITSMMTHLRAQLAQWLVLPILDADGVP